MTRRENRVGDPRRVPAKIRAENSRIQCVKLSIGQNEVEWGSGGVETSRIKMRKSVHWSTSKPRIQCSIIDRVRLDTLPYRLRKKGIWAS